MANPNPPPPPKEYQFKPGQSGNPGGMAKGTRKAIQTRFLNALCKDFDEHGESAIEAARLANPLGYVNVVASLLPKQVEETKPLDELTDAELVAGIALLRSRLAETAGSGAGQAPSTTTTQ
jgi:hypothetical protein